MLYIRMLLTMGVSLYTSRVVLATLGVEDYGIYNIVGGVIVMFGFLNSSMSGATSRFLTFELGQDNYEKLKKTFSAALTVHILIAGIILILGETVGLWWLENKLVIPTERINPARWVYHLSILSAMVSITQVPYNATLIAHERMNVYAYVEILNGLLKLGIVYLLVIGDFDKLILYAALTLLVTIIITTIYKLYCTKNFQESHYKFGWNKEIIYPMLSFSGWDLYGNMCWMARGQGVNILLNLFFGVVVNAAYGIASQVQNVVQVFAKNFLTAVQPQIIKYYASGEIEKMEKLIINTAKFSFLLIFIICLPVLLETHFILQLWLKKVPDYAVAFCRLNILDILVLFSLADFVVGNSIRSTGKIKQFSIIGGTIVIFLLPISYFFLRVGFSPITPFVLNVLLSAIVYLVNIFILHSVIPQFSIYKILKQVTFIALIFASLSSILPLYFHYSFDEGWKRFLMVGASSVFSISLACYFIILNRDMRKRVTRTMLSKITH